MVYPLLDQIIASPGFIPGPESYLLLKAQFKVSILPIRDNLTVLTVPDAVSGIEDMEVSEIDSNPFFNKSTF